MASLPHSNPGPATGAADAADHTPLSMAPVGWRRVITDIDGPDRSELEREGIHVGTVVVIAARTPLGGPLVVELGRARLALSTKVAAQVQTRPLAASDGPAS